MEWIRGIARVARQVSRSAITLVIGNRTRFTVEKEGPVKVRRLCLDSLGTFEFGPTATPSTLNGHTIRAHTSYARASVSVVDSVQRLFV